MRPKLLVLQGKRNFDVPTYVESDSVRKHFTVAKAQEISGSPDLIYCQAYGLFHEELTTCGIPYVLHVGGSPWLELRGDRFERTMEIVRKARLVVCNSRFLLRVFRTNLPRAKNLATLPGGLWGLDHTPLGPMPSRFDPPKTDYSIKGRPVVAMSMNLIYNSVVKNKWGGVPIFLDAVKKVSRRLKVRFVCYGRGKDFPPLREWRQLGDFEFFPSHHLDDSEDRWPSVLRDADLFAHPSLFDCWPRSVADAACAGVPAIVFGTTGCPEPSPAVIVHPGDFGEMERVLDTLLSNEKTRRDVGTRMRAHALEMTEKHRGDYVKLLREVL